MILIGGALILAVVVSLLIMAAKDMMKHGIHKLTWRFFTGHSLDGKYRTDATWTRRATKVTHPTGRVMRWHHMPRVHRMWIRWCCVIVPILLAWSAVWNWRITLECLATVAGCGVITLAVYVVHRTRQWYNNRVLVTPMARGLESLLMLTSPEIVRATHLDNGYLTHKAGKFGHIELPGHFRAAPEDRVSVEHYIRSRIPRDLDFQWVTNIPKPRLEFHAEPEPVGIVLFEKYLAAMEDCKPGEVFMGLANKTGKPYYGSFNTDDPHWGASVGSGGGKSTWLMSLIAQILHNDLGASAWCIDPKITSLLALQGVPGVRIENNPREVPKMWAMVAELKEIMFQRLDEAEADPTKEFSTFLLIMDEINSFAAMTKKIWASLGNKGVADVWGDIAFLLWMGRVVNIHVVAVGQRLDDKSTGNIGLRDSLGFRALARYKKNQWDMLFSGKFQQPHKKRGQWIYESGDEQTWVQNVIGSVDPVENAKIIRDWALMGRLGANRKAHIDKT